MSSVIHASPKFTTATQGPAFFRLAHGRQPYRGWHGSQVWPSNSDLCRTICRVCSSSTIVTLMTVNKKTVEWNHSPASAAPLPTNQESEGATCDLRRLRLRSRQMCSNRMEKCHNMSPFLLFCHSSPPGVWTSE